MAFFFGVLLLLKYGIVLYFESLYSQSPIIIILKQKLRLLEELEDTWLPYLTPKDDEFYQQVRSLTISIDLWCFVWISLSLPVKQLWCREVQGGVAWSDLLIQGLAARHPRSLSVPSQSAFCSPVTCFTVVHCFLPQHPMLFPTSCLCLFCFFCLGYPVARRLILQASLKHHALCESSLD